MTAVRDIEQDEKPGRPVLSMRVKASVVGASFLVLLGLIACQEMPNAVQALRSLGQSATLVGNESQPPEREIPPGSLEQENPVQVENEPPPELVEEEEPLGQETASLEEEAPTVVLSPDLVASATLPLFPAVAASGPKILWNRTYGGPGDDVGSQIIQAWGDYVVAGYTTSFGAYREDFYLLKIDDAGNMLWNETYERSTQDLASCILDSPDGGFIIAGRAEGTQGEMKGQRPYLLKVDDNGEKMWDKTYRNKSQFFAVTASEDGGFVAAGGGTVPSHLFNVYILRIDADGNALWQKIYEKSYSTEADAIVRTGDGGFLVAGGCTSGLNATKDDVYILKIDADGNALWEKIYGGGLDDWARCIAVSGDGGYVVAGSTESFGSGREDVYVLKIDGRGERIWERAYGGSGREWANSITGTFDGYILAGRTTSFGAGDYDVYILKVDEEGDLVWNMTFGGPGLDTANSIVQSWEGGFLVAGQTSGSPSSAWTSGSPSPTLQRDILVLSGYEGELPVEELFPLFGPLAFLVALRRLARARHEASSTIM